MARTSDLIARAVEPPQMGQQPSYASLDEAFPHAKPGLRPFGSCVIVQIRTPKKKHGLIELVEETKNNEMWNTQVAKVISLGPVAFRNRQTLAPWPEGDWVKVGDYVRIPRYGGDTWAVPTNKGDAAIFRNVNDLDLRGEVDDPLAMIAYI